MLTSFCSSAVPSRIAGRTLLIFCRRAHSVNGPFVLEFVQLVCYISGLDSQTPFD
uniref:Uncharacterized protein n=1 Tax=Anguilla anguilla TaxID=7936 RepID=A0A0E9XJP0_ANGAN